LAMYLCLASTTMSLSTRSLGYLCEPSAHPPPASAPKTAFGMWQTESLSENGGEVRAGGAMGRRVVGCAE
jgi:hypothetical protein